MHPNAQLLEKMYATITRGDLPLALTSCADSITFQIAGKSSLAGKHSKASLTPAFADKFKAMISTGTLKLEVHDIMATDRHGVALVSQTLSHNGQQVLIRSSHVWRFENGRPVAWYDYPRDLYQYDEAWS